MCVTNELQQHQSFDSICPISAPTSMPKAFQSKTTGLHGIPPADRPGSSTQATALGANRRRCRRLNDDRSGPRREHAWRSVKCTLSTPKRGDAPGKRCSSRSIIFSAGPSHEEVVNRR